MSSMQIEPLGIEGVWKVTSPVFPDERGIFREWFKDSAAAAALGFTFPLAQANVSVSRNGVVRGIHYSLAPEGQAKWVTCAAGAVRDVIVDIRVGSPTFGNWVHVDLSADEGISVLISPGLGHGFSALTADSALVYLLSSKYAPEHEHEINPLDPALGIDWNVHEPWLSPKDQLAPALDDVPQGLLPLWP